MVKDFSLTIIKHSTDVGETEARVEKCLVVVETKKAIELFPEAKLKLIYEKKAIVKESSEKMMSTSEKYNTRTNVIWKFVEEAPKE